MLKLIQVRTLEDRREFVRAFISGVTVYPDEPRIQVQIRKIPALGAGIFYLPNGSGARI